MDPEGGDRGSRPCLKNQKKYRVSKQYWSLSPEKSQSYQASIQCWANIGPPAKHHLNGVSLAGWWGPRIVVFGSYLPLSTKKKWQLDHLWQNILDPHMKTVCSQRLQLLPCWQWRLLIRLHGQNKFISMSNNLDQDQAWHSVGTDDLGSNF